MIDVHRDDREPAAAASASRAERVGAARTGDDDRPRPRRELVEHGSWSSQGRSAATAARARHGRGLPGDGAVRRGVDARASQARGSSSSATVGSDDASRHAASSAPMPAAVFDAAHEALADLVLAHLHLDAEELLELAADAALLAALCSTRAMRSAPLTWRWPSSFIT